jgi:radical SAM superfamily enzyme YgiQ (UPF0313 family)
MKVLLINPPAENEIRSCNPDIIGEERGWNPPLGILYLAGYLEKYSNFDIKIIDAQVEEMDYPTLEKAIVKVSPDVVGITAMTFTLLDVLKVVEIVKRVSPGSKVVLGGPHVHIYPSEAINLPGVDYLVLGEGEEAFHQLISYIDDFGKLRHVKALVFKQNGAVINTGTREFNRCLDKLPFPARHLTPYKKYTSLLAKANPITTMFTSRGCPYKCTFCDRPTMGRLFRARSPINIVDEMEHCSKMGIKEILFYDDTFNVDKNRVKDICDLYMQRKLNIAWNIRARVNTVDKEMLDKLKKANCNSIHYGVESGNQRVLDILKKGITLDRVKQVFRMTKEVGISTMAYFMIGCPSETRKEILETIEFAKILDPDFVQITLFTPFPATEAYATALRRGTYGTDFWLEFAKNPNEAFRTRYLEENLTAEELQELLVRAYKEFYVRPRFIVKRLLEVRTAGELTRKLHAGIKLMAWR